MPAKNVGRKGLAQLFDVDGIYLNHASVSPLPLPTVEAINLYLRERAIYGSRKELEWFERVEEIRKLAADFLGASPEEIAFIKSTTHGLIFIAQGLPLKKGDEVITVNGEFPANIYPWLSLRKKGIRVKFLEPQSGRVELFQIEKLITERTRLLALSFVDYLTGHKRDLREIGKFLRERGIFLSVDAIQGLGALKLDLTETPIDFLASGGTKWLFSPMGTGILYVRKELLDLLDLPVIGWRGVKNFLDFSHYNMTPKEGARRFEMDTYNLAGLMGFGASLKLISDIGIEEIERRVIGLTDLFADRLNSLKKVKILTPRSSEREKSGIVTFKIEGVSSLSLKEKLQKEGITVSEREGWIRVSPHFYNREEEIESLIRSMEY